MAVFGAHWRFTAAFLLLSPFSLHAADNPLIKGADTELHNNWKVAYGDGLEAMDDGRFSEAEILLRIAVSEADKLGPERSEVSDALSGLATLFLIQKRYSEAEPLFKRALLIEKKALGSEHEYVGRIVNNLAVVEAALNKYTEAESLFKKALVIREKALGTGHLDVAATLDGLAGLYAVQRKSYEALVLLKKALAIREQILGTDHLEVAKTLQNMSAIYLSPGYSRRADLVLSKGLVGDNGEDSEQAEAVLLEAEALLRRALAIRDKRLGTDDEVIVDILSCLIHCTLRRADRINAEPLLRRLLLIQEKTHGPDHPRTAEYLGILGEIYIEMGRYLEAETLLRRAVRTLEKHKIEDMEQTNARGGLGYYKDILHKAIRSADIMSDPNLRPTEADFEFLRNSKAFNMEKIDNIKIFNRKKLRAIGDIDNTALSHIRGLINLEDVFIYSNEITDGGLVYIENLKNLKKLTLHVKIMGPGLVKLKKMQRLTSLDLGGVLLDDAGLANVPDLANLEKICLSQSHVSDTCIVHISRFKNLKEIDLTGTYVSATGLNRLRECFPKLNIIHDMPGY